MGATGRPGPGPSRHTRGWSQDLLLARVVMMTVRCLTTPAAGGSVLAQWEHHLAAVPPEPTGHTWGMKSVAEAGGSDIAPDAAAIREQFRSAFKSSGKQPRR